MLLLSDLKRHSHNKMSSIHQKVTLNILNFPQLFLFRILFKEPPILKLFTSYPDPDQVKQNVIIDFQEIGFYLKNCRKNTI